MTARHHGAGHGPDIRAEHIDSMRVRTSDECGKLLRRCDGRAPVAARVAAEQPGEGQQHAIAERRPRRSTRRAFRRDDFGGVPLCDRTT
jgi:hypothetical protein